MFSELLTLNDAQGTSEEWVARGRLVFEGKHVLFAERLAEPGTTSAFWLEGDGVKAVDDDSCQRLHVYLDDIAKREQRP